MIHTIGDSHSSTKYSGWKHCKNVISHHIGPVLCYSFGIEPLKRIDVKAINDINDGDTIIFCFGEIDCRNHIHKQVSIQNTSHEIIITRIVCNYINAIKTIVNALGKKLKNVCIYNVIPTLKEEKIKTLNFNGHPFPFVGSDSDRNRYTIFFNKQLKKNCHENSFIFFDIYDKIIDKNGTLREELSDGNSHLSDGYALNGFINNHLL